MFQALMLRERSKPENDEAYQRWLKTHTGAEESHERLELFEERKALLDAGFRNGQLFQTRCYVTLRVLPDSQIKVGKTMGVFSHLAFGYPIGKKAKTRSRQLILEDLRSGLESLRTGLQSLGFDVTLVSKEERIKVIYEWLNPDRSRALLPPSIEKGQMISDRVGLTDLIESRSGLSLGRTPIASISLKSLPEISIPGAMGALSSAQIPFWLFFTVYVLPQTGEREKLLRRQRVAQGMASGNSVRNLMAEAQLKDIEDTLTALISSGEKLLAVSMQMHSTEREHL